MVKQFKTILDQCSLRCIQAMSLVRASKLSNRTDKYTAFRDIASGKAVNMNFATRVDLRLAGAMEEPRVVHHRGSTIPGRARGVLLPPLSGCSA